ncbi:hypothetical protein [Vibrio sp. VB16]|uniref:hypothetical protein n=1 Tax=Vibrio sp. VB16 TaxID=2785746 RepID=UPI00189DEC05|nr:hypothetical protein [Vibrio sp. VB16]UGA56671.1 hypothetical protein IUZ65_020965 [Vibrio sp. VB16]
MFRMLVVCCLMFSGFSSAENELVVEPEMRGPLIELDIVVDTKGIEEAILITNQSMKQVIEALNRISDNQELTPEQAAIITSTSGNISQLAMSSTEVVEALPEAITKARESVVANARVFLSDLKMNILIVLILVVVGLAIVIACLYWFVIRPMQSTILAATGNVASMANSIQITAKSLEESNKTHAKLLEMLEQNHNTA